MSVPQEFMNAVKTMVQQGRTHFGSPGASLTHQAYNPKHNRAFSLKAVNAGLAGERVTSQIIRRWMAEKCPTAILVDSCHINGLKSSGVDEEDGNIDGPDTDHVLIIGDAIILIDSKRWKSKRKYSISPKGKVLRSGKYFPSGSRVHAKSARYLWATHLRTKNVTSIVCIAQEKVHVTRDKNWWKAGFRLVERDKLTQELDRILETVINKENVNIQLVSEVVACAVKPFKIEEKIGATNL